MNCYEEEYHELVEVIGEMKAAIDIFNNMGRGRGKLAARNKLRATLYKRKLQAIRDDTQDERIMDLIDDT